MDRPRVPAACALAASVTLSACSGGAEPLSAPLAARPCAPGDAVSTPVAWWKSDLDSRVEENRYIQTRASKSGPPSPRCKVTLACAASINVATINELLDDRDVLAALAAPAQFRGAPEVLEYKTDRTVSLSLRLEGRELRLESAKWGCSPGNDCPRAPAGLVRLAETLEALDAQEAERCSTAP